MAPSLTWPATICVVHLEQRKPLSDPAVLVRAGSKRGGQEVGRCGWRGPACQACCFGCTTRTYVDYPCEKIEGAPTYVVCDRAPRTSLSCELRCRACRCSPRVAIYIVAAAVTVDAPKKWFALAVEEQRLFLPRLLLFTTLE